MNKEELFRNKIIIDSPTSISIGHTTWFTLDTKLVGRVKALLNENEEKDKEIERLNNIINGIEKYLIDKFNTTQDTRYCDDLIKLKELKENK